MAERTTVKVFAGIDAGSRTIKAVLFDAVAGRAVGRAIVDQGVDQSSRADRLFLELLEASRVAREDVVRIVATGYGRDRVEFADTTITEITCHATGARHWLPETKTVIDIGGQDSKLIRLDGRGDVRDFAMNDRCAAGTGRFLEVVAKRLEISLDALGETASRSVSPATISSMCVVFAETEIVGLLAEGVAREDIVAGVRASVASRVAGMAGRGVESPVVFTGGVALIPGMGEALGAALGCSVRIPDGPEYTGALGAAILAAGRPRRSPTDPACP